jgi:SAM-dependent methyltransferase
VTGTDWRTYLASFHDERAGITEAVLDHARDAAGRTPYDWAAEAVPAGAVVVDLACGSGPVAGHLRAPRRYLGLDLSPAELRAARAKGLDVGRADATRLPLLDACADAVVMSMALMLVPLAQTLAEVRRVLRPGGLFVATVPHDRPMPTRDWLRYARLCLALRHAGLSYPNDRALAGPGAAFAAAGLTLIEDEARAFGCRLTDAGVADELLASLYLPDVAEDRMDAGPRVVRGWVGTRLTTPVRRLVARA